MAKLGAIKPEHRPNPVLKLCPTHRLTPHSMPAELSQPACNGRPINAIRDVKVSHIAGTRSPIF